MCSWRHRVVFAAPRAHIRRLLFDEHRRLDGWIRQLGSVVVHKCRTYDAEELSQITELAQGKWLHFSCSRSLHAAMPRIGHCLDTSYWPTCDLCSFQLELGENKISTGLHNLLGCPKLSHLSLSNNRIEDLDTLEPLVSYGFWGGVAFEILKSWTRFLPVSCRQNYPV